MLGIIFTELADFCVHKVGLKNWNNAVDELNLPSEAAYTTGLRYNDDEATQILTWLQKTTGEDISSLLREFGLMLFETLSSTSVGKNVVSTDFISFLKHIDKTTHDKVRVYYPESSPPDFEVIETQEGLTMHYRSTRKLCFLAEGLIEASAKFYQKNISIRHTVCMHKGDDHCELTVLFND